MSVHFICNDCGGGFTRKYNLKRHKENRCRKRSSAAKIVSGASLDIMDTLSGKNPKVEDKVVEQQDDNEPTKLYSVIQKIITPRPPSTFFNFKQKDADMLKEEFNVLYNKNEPTKNLTELTVLLDKMLNRSYITLKEHEILIKNLSENVKKKNEKEDEILQNLIQTTFQYIIKHDKEELKKLLIDDPDKKFLQLINTFFLKEYDDIDGEEIYPKIYDIITHRVEVASLIEDKIHQLNIQILLRDINDNRYRVKAILTRLKDSQNFMATLNQLYHEELLSQVQYDKMKELGNNNNLQAIADIIKDTKYGQGLKFLPRELSELRKDFQRLITKTESEGITKLEKNLMTAYLNELLKQKVITEHECNSVKEEIYS